MDKCVCVCVCVCVRAGMHFIYIYWSCNDTINLQVTSSSIIRTLHKSEMKNLLKIVCLYLPVSKFCWYTF